MATTEELIGRAVSDWDRLSILSLIDDNDLEAVLQPIYSANTGSVYGFESLIRVRSNPTANIDHLFTSAKKEKLISTLDVTCRGYAFQKAMSEGLQRKNALIFINICPETLMDPAHRTGITDDLAEECGISKDRIVIEITEESASITMSFLNRRSFTTSNRAIRSPSMILGPATEALKCSRL